MSIFGGCFEYKEGVVVMEVLWIIGAGILFFFIWSRHIPVSGLTRTDELPATERVLIIDMRDFQDSHKAPIEHAVNLPWGYLQRNHQQIPQKPIHLIVPHAVTRNGSVRYLRRKGFTVESYSFASEFRMKT